MEHIFEIFPSKDFKKSTGEMAMDQLDRIVGIMKDKSSNRKVPNILDNSVILDIIQDYLNQCGSYSVDDFCFNSKMKKLFFY